ncbi:MAG: HD domain-containing protein, partial [Anaerolineae bacterium]
MSSDDFINSMDSSDFSNEERSMILTALEIADRSHSGYFRREGIPYVEHSLSVASILLAWKSPPYLIAAGLLHDVLNPNYSTLPSINSLGTQFGEGVVTLVKASEEFSRIGATKSFGKDARLLSTPEQ